MPADQYAGEAYVVKRLDVVIAMNADGTGYTERTMVLKVQSEAALREFGVVGMSFASSSEHVEIHYVRVRHSDGSVIETPVSGVIEQPEQITVQAPFYSDLKEAQLPVKSLQVGDTLEWQIRVVRTKSEASNQFWGQESFITEEAVVLAESVELRVPSTTSVNVWTNPKLDMKPVDSVAEGEHIYRWQHANLKPTTGAAADLAKEAKKKTLWTADEELDDEQGKLPSVAWTTFKSWKAVGEWYRGLEADRIIPDQSVKDKVAELTAGKLTEEDKVRAVYAYVSTQIRYIGVAFGVGRYQPHHAEEVLENQYGDCKDKHTLLAAMLTVLGLHPDAALIGSQIRFNEAVPSPDVFNHLITHVVVSGQPIWLDSTAEVAPYQMLIRTIRDKQALVVPDAGAAKLEHTPADPPFATVETWKSVGTLDKNGISDSHFTISLRGDDELGYRQALRQFAPSQYDDAIQRMANGIGYAGTTSHADVSRVEDTKAPLTIEFDYHREKAGDWDHYKTVAQLMPDGMPTVDEKEPPVRSIDLGVPRTQQSNVEMKLPDGWSAQLPDAIHEKTAWATYDETYRLEKGVLYAEERLVVLQEKVPASEWKAYLKWQTAVGLDDLSYIQLLLPGEKPSTQDESDDTAANLIHAAEVSIRKGDLSTASSLLDDARKVDEKHWNLWGVYAEIANAYGDQDKAIEMYQKEIGNHPDNYWAYDSMAQVQWKKGQHKESIETLRKWTSLDTGSTKGELRLIYALTDDGSADDAVKEAETALQRVPEEKRTKDPLYWSLGWAQLKSATPDKGVATYKAILNSTDDLNDMNNIAYELSEVGQGLDLAESTEHSMLDKAAAQSANWTLQDSDQLRKNTELLAISWDTMGWIFYKEGKYEEARKFIEAAWKNRQYAAIGTHLGDVWMMLKNPGEANTAYELTSAIHGGIDMKSKLDEAKAAGGRSTLKDKNMALQNVRTLLVGPSHGLSTTAEYRLLISHDKVEAVEPTGDKTVPGGAEMLQKMTFAQLFPEATSARLLYTGMLNCHEQICELVLEDQ